MSQQIYRSARTGEAYGTTCEARRPGPGGARVTVASKEGPFIAAGASRIMDGMGTSRVGNRPISSPRAERTGNKAGERLDPQMRGRVEGVLVTEGKGGCHHAEIVNVMQI